MGQKRQLCCVFGVCGMSCGRTKSYPAAAKEFAVRGISVNSVAPGPMDTPFFYAQETPERVAFLKSQGLGGRLTEVEDIVPLVVFLATEGGWISGQTIFANGGFTTR